MDWLYFVCLVCFAGATLGTVSHVLFGLCFVETPDYGHLAALGFLHGLKYSSLWAGGWQSSFAPCGLTVNFKLRAHNLPHETH